VFNNQKKIEGENVYYKAKDINQQNSNVKKTDCGATKGPTGNTANINIFESKYLRRLLLV
jgi:hypothetical protein